MVEILIISYNALPLDVVSSYRAKAYCDHFISYGIRPTLLTHRWEYSNGSYLVHERNAEVIVEEGPTCTVIRLPNPGAGDSKSKLHTILSYCRGDFDVSLLSSYQVFKDFLWKHLKDRRYQLIMGIFNPHFHLKLAHECQQAFNIPYVLDFRDLWENAIVTSSYRPGIRQQIIDRLIMTSWKRWIRNSMFFSTTGDKWRGFLTALSGKEGIVVRNGFQDIRDQDSAENYSTSSKFKVIHFGRLYKEQNIEVFLQGFRIFCEKFSPDEVGLEIVGLKRCPGVDHEQRIRQVLGRYVSILPYKSKPDLIAYCCAEASIFMFPNFKEDNGQFPVKLYDYIMMRKNILVSPAGGDIGEFVSEMNVGVVLNDPESVAQGLGQYYEVFRKYGFIPLKGNNARLNEYSRKEQVRVMARKIHAVVGTTNSGGTITSV